jgi:hypothetical protein
MWCSGCEEDAMTTQMKAAKRDWAREYQRAKALWCYKMVRLDHDDMQALRELARRKHTTVAELIRTFVTWGLENEYDGADKD